MRTLQPTSIALFAVALLAGCAAPPPETPEEIESALRERSRAAVAGDGFLLRSPCSIEATEPYATVVGRELRSVRACFGDTGGDAVRVYLVPGSEADVPEEEWRHAARGGFEGGAFATGFAFVWVRPGADPAQAMVQAELGSPQIRHELAHLLARRAGLAGKSWFNEGVAQHVEHAQLGDGEMRPHPFPMTLVRARDGFAPGDVARLLAWSLADESTVEERASRYAKAEALLRFLLERASGPDFVARLHDVQALDEKTIAALEPEWRAWLRSQDALAAVRRELAAPSVARRREGAALLPVLAEAGARELSGEAADAVALDALRDHETFGSAATFLVFFRARSLSEDRLSSLQGSSDPCAALLASALRARRGEPFDLERARRIWNDLDPRARSTCSMLAAVIPGLDVR